MQYLGSKKRSIILSESPWYRIRPWVEDTLIKEGTFSLPRRKTLLKNDVEYEVVLIDTTETPIERPKKTKTLLFWQTEKS